MQEKVKLKANAFKNANELAIKNEIVIYGSTYMANFPFYELSKKIKLENAVYNRSIEGLTISEALNLLQVCVLDLSPAKIFIALGEEDYNLLDAIYNYNSIIKQIRYKLPQTEIYLICLNKTDEKATLFNKNIHAHCDGKKVFCIKFNQSSLSNPEQYKKRFKELCCFFRSSHITTADAFAIASI